MADNRLAQIRERHESGPIAAIALIVAPWASHAPFGMNSPMMKAPSSIRTPSATIRIPFLGPGPSQEDLGTAPFATRAFPPDEIDAKQRDTGKDDGQSRKAQSRHHDPGKMKIQWRLLIGMRRQIVLDRSPREYAPIYLVPARIAALTAWAGLMVFGECKIVNNCGSPSGNSRQQA